MRPIRYAAILLTALLCGCASLPFGRHATRYGDAYVPPLSDASGRSIYGLGKLHYGLRYGATVGGEVGSYSNATALNGTERILADQTSGSYPCIACTVNITPAQIVSYFTSGSFTLNDCIKVAATNPLAFADAGLTCGGGSMTWPAAAGIAVYSGSNSWSTSITTLAGLNTELGVTIPSISGAITTGDLTKWSSATGVGDSGIAVTAVPLLTANNTFTGTNTAAGYIDSGITAGTSPICPNGTSGAFTTVGCSGGGSPTFSSVTSGTNTTAAMLVGSGGSLGPTGTGTVNANQVNGAAPATSAAIAATNSSGQVIAATTTGSGSAVQANSPTLITPVLTGYATSGLPTCASGNKGELAYTTDGTPAFTFCNGTSWVNSGGTQFTYVATGCTPSASAGSATAGTITLAAGPCTSIVITFNGAVGMSAPNGWHCNVSDRALNGPTSWFGEWGESTSTTTTATIQIPGAAGATDTISFNCSPF